MTIADTLARFVAIVAGHPLLERLFFASVELAVLAALVWLAVRVARIQSARVVSLLWLVVLAKPVVALALGSPLHVLRLEVAGTAEKIAGPPLAARLAAGSPPLSKGGSGGVAPQELEIAEDDWRRSDPFAYSGDVPADRFGEPVTERPTGTASIATAPSIPAAAETPSRWNAATLAMSIWLAGVVLLACRSALDRFRVFRLVRHGAAPADEIRSRCARLASQYRLRRVPRLRITDDLESPALVGSLFPAILIPEWLAREPNAPRLDWALRHELMHWKLRDPLAGLVRELAQVLFYFHPAAWWAGRDWEAAAELACDRAIVTDETDSHDYADQLYGMLVEIRGRRRIPVHSGLFATRTQIARRIAALARGPRGTRAHLSALAAVGIACLFAVALSVGGTFAEKRPDRSAETATPESGTDVTATGNDSALSPIAAPTYAIAAADPPPANSQPGNAAADPTFTYAGTVVDPDGKPVAGAKLFFAYATREAQPNLAPLAITDANGRFQFFQRQDEFDKLGESGGAVWRAAMLIATADGFGFAVAPSVGFETTGRLAADVPAEPTGRSMRPSGALTNILKLVRDDVPVRARILTLEGRPAAGAQLVVRTVWQPRSGSLDTWESAARQPNADFFSALQTLDYAVNGPRAAVVGQSTDPDRDGWITVKGLGRDRIAELQLLGSGIESTLFRVRTRSGETIKLSRNSPASRSGEESYYAAELTHVAAPSPPVVGRVTDSTTGLPIAGCVVQGGLFVRPTRQQLLGVGEVTTLTDVDGRYRLDGLAPISADGPPGRQVHVLPPRGTRYLAATVYTESGPTSEPQTKDVALYPGVRVRGTVTDAKSGQPVRGFFAYSPAPDNAAAKTAPTLKPADQWYYSSDHAGHFELPVYPGKGVLRFVAQEQMRYPLGVGADEARPAMRPAGLMGGPRESNFNLLKLIDPAEGAAELALALTLEPAATVQGRVLSPEGDVLQGYLLYGRASVPGWFLNVGDTFTLVGYTPGEKRRLFFYHPERNLAGEFELPGEPPQNLEVRLRAAGTIMGRVVDREGAPIENASLLDMTMLSRGPRPSPPSVDAGMGAFPPSAESQFIPADAQGRFVIKGLVPGLKYSATASNANRRLLGPLFSDVTVEAGETKDLGDVRPASLRPPGNPQSSIENPKSKIENPAAAPAVDAARNRTVRGRIVDEKGQPISGVALHVPLIVQNRPSTGDADAPHFAETKSDADGRFSLTLKDGLRLPLMAAHPGFAVEQFDIPQQGDVAAAEIVMRAEQPIPGRIVDPEGRPVTGARIPIGRRLVNPSARSLDAFLEERKKEPFAQPVETTALMTLAFIPNSYIATSDEDGRFVIRGIPADGACEIQIGDDRFVHDRLLVVNRRGIDTAPYNRTAPPMGRAPARLVGPDFTHVAVPAVTIEGRATADGKPVADLTVRAGVGVGAGLAGAARTDAEGRYRLPGLPRGREFRLMFGAPGQQTDVLQQLVTVSTTTDDVKKTVDVELKRASVTDGTLLSGRVIDPLTGKGVPAFVRFVPLAGNEFANQPRYNDMQRGRNVRANGAGEFQVPVMPGPGALLVQVNPTIPLGNGRMVSPFRMGVVSEADKAKMKLVDGPMGKSLVLAVRGSPPLSESNAIKYVDLAEGAQAEAVEITLDRGKTAVFEIVDADGQPVTGAAIAGIDVFPIPARLDQSKTTLYGLAADSPRKVIVLHAQRGLAGSLTVSGDEPSPIRLTLGKTASIRGRAVDKSGQPIAEAECRAISQPTFDLSRLEEAGKPLQATGKDGRFRFDNLIPGDPISLSLQVDGKVLKAKLSAEQQPQQPGQETDLGDIVFAGPQ